MTDKDVDLAIIGAGPTGMAAASEARRLGLSVVVIDEQPTLGGQIYRRIETAPQELLAILGKDYAHGRSLIAEFHASKARYIGGALIWNLTQEGIVHYLSPEGNGRIRAKFILLASGAMERPFPIKGWTLPGVMGAGAGQILLKSAMVKPAQPVILAGCGPLLYLLAWQYLRADVPLKAVVDTTASAAYWQAGRYLGGALQSWREIFYGLKLIAAIRTSQVAFYRGADRLEILGETQCEGIRFKHRRRWRQIEAPLILLHHGVVPNVQLSRAVGAEHVWDKQQLCWCPATDAHGHIKDSVFYVAGDGRKIVGAKASALQGRIAALAIAQKMTGANSVIHRLGQLKKQLHRLTVLRPFLDTLYRPRKAHLIPQDDVLVCRCEEISARRLRHDLQLGCLGPNQLKAFSRCGMGPCQGRLCGLTVTQLIAEARQVPPQQVGYYRVRPPIKPIPIGDLARLSAEEP